MMKKFLLLPLLVFAGAVSAQAQTQNQQPVQSRSFPVRGSSPNICVLQAPSVAAGAQVNFRGLNGTLLQIDALVDPATLATNAASVELRFDAVCNFPHRLKVEALNNGLWRNASGAAPQGFASAIPYQARFNWGQQTLLLNADAQIRRFNEQTLRVADPTAGTVSMRFEIQPGASNVQSNAPVIAGTYAETLRITLEPQR
jgi:hypothetical protein